MSYQEQFKRVKRYLLKIDPPQSYHGDQVEYEDNLWSFFQNAWHLKDWIKNDNSIKKIPIEKITSSYNSLKVCADLANRTKHHQLKTKRVDAKHSRTDVTIVVPIDLPDLLKRNERPAPIIKAKGSFYNYVINDNMGNNYNAIDLAKEIVKDWEEIITKYIEN